MVWAAWGGPLVVVGVLVLGFVSLLAYLRLPMKAVAIPIRGRHLVVTGGSSGIGLEVAKLAAAEGARVSLVARDERKLADAKSVVTEYCRQQLNNQGAPVQVNVYSADVKEFGSISKAIEAAVADSGVVEVLVLSHGVSSVLTFEDQPVEDIDHVIDTNLKGNIHTIKAALPHIKACTGAPASISIIASQAGQVGVYGYAAYSASKFALRGLAEVLQQELIVRNIRLSLVYPPDTMTASYLEDRKTMSELTAKLSGTSTVMDAVSVARASLAGLKAGDFHINCNLEGAALSLLCSGMGPQPSLWKAMAEVLAMGVLRLVALFVQRDWYDTILQSKRKDYQAKNIIWLADEVSQDEGSGGVRFDFDWNLEHPSATLY